MVPILYLMCAFSPMLVLSDDCSTAIVFPEGPPMCPPPGLILSAPTQPRDPTADAAQSKLPVSNKSSFCPPLQSATLDISCYLDSSDRPCEEPQPPGTVVLFKCKPQYSGDLRSGNATHCGPGGTWTRPLPSCKPEGCPPLQWPTVLAECTHDGQPVACSEQPSPTGTVARFRCKPLHQFLFGYLPSSGLESRCRSDREWSTTPFRCAPICGQPTGKAIGFVRDGILSNSAADFPWHVSIYDRTLDNEQVCGGSLITTKFFVSAAHCFHNGTFHPETIYLAGFGKIKRSVDVVEANEQYRKLRKIYLKDYGGRNQLYSNDISIVELQSDVDITSSTMPVCMDWSFDLPELQHGDLGVVVGYGNTLDNPHADLHFAKLPFIKSDECKHRVSDSLAIYNKLQDKFCIGFINRSTVAKGDSGGGIAFPNKDRVWFLRGIVSVGSSQETTYSFFTNVTKFIPWISATIQQGEVTGRRCGVDVSQEGPESGGQYGFPWEVDLYFKRTSNRKFEILSTGALIQRNLVITRVRSDSTSGQAIDLSEYPVTWLRVASRRSAVFENLEKAANVSQVIRAFSPSDVTAKSGLFYNFILLELRTPLHLMPVCVDWTGSALLQKQHHGTVISNQKSENSSLSTRQYILSPTECKFKITPPPENHHICTLQDGDKEKTSSLYVFANNNWFLRGVESRALHSPNGTISVYTDMGDPGVRQWLTKTNHILGKATCGNVNLCESLSSGMSLAGHLPWNVAVVAVDETGKQTKHSAILIKPNAVLTASAFLVDMIHWNGKGKLPKFPVNNITVIWTAFDGNTKTSRVSRVIVRDVGESLRDDQPRVDVALLELRGDKPLPTMTPVCLDFSGSVLQELATGQLGLVESWSSWSESTHSLASVSFMGPKECNIRLRQFSNRSKALNEFCTSAAESVLEPTVQGGGFLVSSGSQWYLQGLYTGYVKLRHQTIALASDFRDESLRKWLQQEIENLQKVNITISDDSGPKNCVGGRPSGTECGVFKSTDELQGEDEYLFKTSQNRMEWNVEVHVDRGDRVWDVRSGILVRASMVVTCALDLFNGTQKTASGEANTIPTSNVIVKYISSDNRGPFSVEVDAIHLRERCPRCSPRPEWASHLHYDLALLELKTPVTLMPVCVPRPGVVASPLNSLTEGLVEVRQGVYSSQLTLVPTLVRNLGDCRVKFPIDFLDAEFCTTSSSGELQNLPLGAGYSVLAGDAWFLRGLKGINWDTRDNTSVSIFYNIDNPRLRDWLAERMKTAPQTKELTTAPAAEKEEQIKCGQTTVPIFSLVKNQTLSGPLPWTVAVNIDSNEKLFNMGVLIRSDIVVTDANYLVDPPNIWNDTGSVRTIDPGRIRVVWINPSGRRLMSQIVSVDVRERDRDSYTTTRTFDVAVLRLKTPFKTSTRICSNLLDETNLPSLKRYQMGVTESWQVSLLDFQSSIEAVPYVNYRSDRCLFMTTRIPQVYITPDRFCTGPVQVSNLTRVGAGFFVRKRDSWFLHGILSFNFWKDDFGKDDSLRWVITDLNDDGVKLWLREKIATKSSDQGVPTTARKLNKCGQADSSLRGLTPGRSQLGHMSWSVLVYFKKAGRKADMFPGVLVRDDVIITDGSQFFAIANETHSSIDSRTVFVIWVSPSGRRKTCEVAAVYVPGEETQNGMALLRLRTPFLESIPACLDIWNDTSVFDIAMGGVGVMADTTMPVRTCTFTFNFLKEEGGRPPAKDLCNFIVRHMQILRDDIEGLDQEFGTNRVHLKIKFPETKEDEWWYERLAKRKVQMDCEDGTRRTVYVTNNGLELSKVKIRNLPFEVSKEQIEDALSDHIHVCDVIEERYGENHVFRSIKTGVRTVLGSIRKDIPSYFEIAGWTGFIEYPGQPRTCALCDSTEHLRAKCKERERRMKLEEGEREEETDEEEQADDDSDAAPERRRAESEPPPSLPPLLAATPPAASAPSADDAPPQPSSPPADVTPPADEPPGESEQPASDVTCPAADTPPGDNSQPQQQPVSEQATREKAWDKIKEQARDRSLSRKREASKSPEEERGVQTRRAKMSTAERKREKLKKKK